MYVTNMRIIRKTLFFRFHCINSDSLAVISNETDIFFFFFKTDYICIRKFPLVESETGQKIERTKEKKHKSSFWLNKFFFPSRFFQFCLRNRSRTHLLHSVRYLCFSLISSGVYITSLRFSSV